MKKESDHLSICVYIKAKNVRQSVLEKEKDFEKRNFKQQIWPEEGIKNFREILEIRKLKKTDLEDSWEELKAFL